MRATIPVLICGLALLSACTRSNGGAGPDPVPQPAPGTTWVATAPTQCLTNAWEQDWLEHHDHDYGSYPKDPATPYLEPREIEVIVEYYAGLGVVIHDVTAFFPTGIAVCLACSCPEGHTLFLRVPDEDVDFMVGLGYRVVSPPGR